MDLNNVSVKGKRVLLIDDIISTGGTILKALKFLKSNHAFLSLTFVGSTTFLIV